MKTSVRSTKRINLINAIIETMLKHEIFSDIVSRKKDTESQIQKALFLRLQKKLPEILTNVYGLSLKRASQITQAGFMWEQKLSTVVSHFDFFATKHRPDSILEIANDMRIAIEIKKGSTGSSIRAGIGQSLVYATQFNFVIYFFVDITPGLDIKNSMTAKREANLMQSLWDNYNIKFQVV